MSSLLPLRQATPEEFAAAKGSWFYQMGAAYLESYYTKWTLANHKNKKNDHLKDTAPVSQRIAECALYWMGRNPDYPHVSVLYGTPKVYMLWNRNMIQELFLHHRQGILFKPNSSDFALTHILREAFPEGDLTDDDFLMTCSPDQTISLHRLLKEPLSRKAIKKDYVRMIELCDEAIGKIAAARDAVNIEDIAQTYVLDVIGLVFFKKVRLGQLLGALIPQFKEYLNKVSSQTDTPDDKARFQNAMDTFRNMVTTFSEDWSTSKNQALFFGVLMAQESSATLVTALFAHLSKQWRARTLALSEAAEDFFAKRNYSPFEFPKVIEEYYEEVMRIYPPTPIVTRTAAVDLMAGNTFIPQGSIVVARMIAIQDRFFGEHGPHTCVGRDLAKIMSVTFLMRFIELYDASFERPKNYHLILEWTGKIEPPVRITCNKREPYGFPASKVYPD